MLETPSIATMTITETWVPAPPAADTFAGRLRLIRFALGDVSVSEMERRTGIPSATWRSWEAGSRPHKFDESINLICAKLRAGGLVLHRDWLAFGDPADEAKRLLLESAAA